MGGGTPQCFRLNFESQGLPQGRGEVHGAMHVRLFCSRGKVKLRMRTASKQASRRTQADASSSHLVELIEDDSRVVEAPVGQGRRLPAAASVRVAVVTVPRKDVGIQSLQLRRGQCWPAAAQRLAGGRVQALCKPAEVHSIDFARAANDCQPPALVLSVPGTPAASER